LPASSSKPKHLAWGERPCSARPAPEGLRGRGGDGMRRYFLPAATIALVLVAILGAFGGSGSGQSSGRAARASSPPAGTIALISQGPDTKGFGISHTYAVSTGGSVKRLTPRRIDAMFDEWSPDGRSILYARDFKEEFWLMHADGTHHRRLLHTTA